MSFSFEIKDTNTLDEKKTFVNKYKNMKNVRLINTAKEKKK